MLVNLTDVFTSAGKTEEKEIKIEMDIFSYQGTEFRVLEKSSLTLKLSNITSGEACISGNAAIVLNLCCDRCLKDVPYTFELAFERVVKSPERVSELSEEEADEQNFMEGYQLDAENLVSSEIILDWPVKILCKQDCKGICRICGKDLNTENCDCDPFVPDPRMAVLKDIFDASNK